MSRNQKAPLLAFVLVAMVCGLILVDSLLGDAVGQISVFGPPARIEQPATPPGREPSSSETDEPVEASPGAPTGLPDSLGEASPEGDSLLAPSSGDASPGVGSEQDQSTATGQELGSLGSSSSEAPGSDTDQGEDPADGSSDPESGAVPDNPNTEDGSLASIDGFFGLKDPTAGIGNFGPDGGRPEIDPSEPEPLSGEATDGTNAPDATHPTDGPDPVDPDAPVDPADRSDASDRSDQSEQPGPKKDDDKADHPRAAD